MEKDKRIVSSIIEEMLKDDNTFSKSPKDFATIAITKDDLHKDLGEKVPEIEIRLIHSSSFSKEVMSKDFELVDMMGLRPVIKFT
jgi:hypothetical protein